MSSKNKINKQYEYKKEQRRIKRENRNSKFFVKNKEKNKRKYLEDELEDSLEEI